MVNFSEKDGNKGSNPHTNDPIVQNILSSKDSLFVRRAQELIKSKQKVNNISDVLNQDVSAFPIQRKSVSNKSVLEFDEATAMEFGRSPQDAFGAIFSELSSLKNEMERYERSCSLSPRVA